ncbi:MAG: hypothetical protein RJB55_2232 [Verrucomicrobiota bacterium]
MPNRLWAGCFAATRSDPIHLTTDHSDGTDASEAIASGYSGFSLGRCLRALRLVAGDAEDGRKKAHEAHGSWAPLFFLPSQGTSYTSTSVAPPAPLPVTSVVYSPAGRVMSNMASFDDGLVTAKAPTAALAAVS